MKVIAYTTISLDGRIGYVGEKTVLSSRRDLLRLHQYRSLVDAVMVGANTVINDNPLLTVRLPGYRGRQPWRVVIDSKLRTPLNANVYDTSIAPTILITDVENRGDPKVKALSGKGVEIVLVGKKDGILDLNTALRILEEKYGIKRILVEGGGFLIGVLVEEKLLDEIHVTIAPILLGEKGIPYINRVLHKPVKLRLVDAEIDRETNEIILIYKPFYED